MDSFTALEKVDLAALRIIADNYNELAIKDDREDHDGKAFDPLMLRKYLKKVRNGDIPVTYCYSKKAKDHGRQYANGALSLQSFPRAVRHTIAKDLYHDIDIVNAHPTILVQYCEKHGYACDKLLYYIQNRDMCLEEIMQLNNTERDAAKQVVLSLLNGGIKDYERLGAKPAWLEAFKAQVASIQTIVGNSNDVYMQKLKAECKKTNMNGSLINRVLCDIENNILMQCVEFLKSKDISVQHLVLVFDGFMILKGLAELDGVFFDDLQQWVKDKTGYDVTFAEKPMDEVLDLSKHTNRGANNTKGVRIATDDDEASDLFLEDVKHILKKDNTRLFMKTPHYYWTENAKLIKQQLLALCLKSNICSIDERGHEVPYGASVTKAKNIIEATLAKVPETEDFAKQLWESTIGKLCFKNGVYDFNTNKFTPWDNAFGVYTTVVINREFPERDNKKVAEVHKKLLDTIFTPDMKQDWLKYIARGIAGQISDKQWAVGMGERNSGKGKLVNLCESAFGRYVNTINSENFVMERFGSGDEAKKQSWMLDCEYTRLTFSNEIKLDESDKNYKINGNMIKRFASGGDTITARKLYVNEIEFKIQSRLMIMCNDLPPIEPKDATETMVMFKYPYKFVSADEMKNALPFFRLKDASIDDYVKDPEVCDAFVHIIIDHYENKVMQPGDAVAKDTKEYRQDVGNELDILRENFKYTGELEDYVTQEDMKDFIKKHELNMTLSKLKSFLLKINGEHDHKTVNGKRIRAVFYIKMMSKVNPLDAIID